MIFEHSIFPDCLKLGLVTPIFKCNDKTEVNNYRPITVLPILAKIVERVIEKRLSTFIDDINFISANQFGFCKASNTEAAVINLLNDVQTNMDKNKDMLIGLLFIDLSKAYDSISHNQLINKLSNVGVKEKALKLLISYLNNRKQCVKLDTCFSNFEKIDYGVPQGGLISPLLFNIFINDITLLPLKGKIVLYADDICLNYMDSDPDNIIEFMKHDLKILQLWFNNNTLTFNAKKTKFMLITSRAAKGINCNPLIINNIEIERTYNFKYLGLHIDSHLTWHHHIKEIKNKILPIVGILYKLKVESKGEAGSRYSHE
jgi:hypothetical protein